MDGWREVRAGASPRIELAPGYRRAMTASSAGDPRSEAPLPAPRAPALYERSEPPGGWDAAPPDPTPVLAPAAGWWRRVGATLIDGLIIAIPAGAVAVMLVLPLLGPLAPGDLFESVGGFLLGLLIVFGYLMLVLVLTLVTLVLYGGFTMSRPGPRNGQTVGKQALGIRVVRLGADPLTFWSAATREAVLKGLLFGGVGGLFLGIPTVLDILWPLWDREGRALHDMLANTRVVRA